MSINSLTIVSINVGVPREVHWRGKTICTAIFKQPINGTIGVSWLNIEGDRQADVRVHGGRDKAVYAYASEHYDFWKQELPDADLPWGSFGENLTLRGGLFEDRICVGDRFTLGTAELVAVQPRLPCFKLGIRFGTQTMVKRFQNAKRYGVYFRVVKCGQVAVGDRMELIDRPSTSITILELAQALTVDRNNTDVIRRALSVKYLPTEIREHFRSLV